MSEIKQQPEDETTLIFVVGDALHFSLTITDPDPDSPDPDDPIMLPRNLTGWSAGAQIRKSIKLVDPILAAFEFNELDETGVIEAYLTPEQSANLEGLAAGRWDFQIIDPSGDPLTIMRGPAKPLGQVTR